jgi:hypothetical protein
VAKKKQSKEKPENRHKTGFRGPTPEVGKETQFKPGQSGNPGGRPPSILSEAYKEVLAQVFEGDSSHRTYAQLIAIGQARAAVKGNTGAAKEIADRVEGKAKEAIEISGKGGAPLEFNLNIRFVDENEKQPEPKENADKKPSDPDKE